MPTLKFTLNGSPVSLDVRQGESLLEVLRERLDVRSPKDGCAPQGQCGCCLALVGGRALTTCAVPATKAEGQEVTTLEGLPQERRELFGKCFEAAAGLQCGYCIPGIVVRAHHMIEKNPQVTRQELAKGLDGHLCRCTGYKKILDAIENVRDNSPQTECCDGRLGQSLKKYRAPENVLGQRPYVDDLTLEGMLFGAVVMSPYPRAKVLAIRTERAQEHALHVLTADDVPGNRVYGIFYQDWPGLIAVGEEVRCVGDVLAVTVAKTAHDAREAAKLVEVDYEVLPAVLDPRRAIEPDAPQVNPHHVNLLSRSVIRRGDAEAALKGATHVVSQTWQTQRIEHMFLEPESAVAVPKEGGVHLYSQGQGIFDDRRQVASFLGINEEAVSVELVPNGGAFGGKEDMSIQAHAALAAWVSQHPVKITLNREESIRMHPKRHPLWMEYTVGCDAEGRLVAVTAQMIGDSGAYASVGSKVLERAAGHACGPYRVPELAIEAVAAYTNNPPCGAMRGFGVNQSAFAMEGALDLLARKVGIDSWEMRSRNIIEPGDPLTTGQILTEGIGIRQTLDAVKSRYYEARGQGRAVGVACGLKNTGIGNGVVEWGKARLVPEEDGTVSIYCGYTEMGQGLLTVMIQFAVEATGLPAEIFRPKIDSTFALGCGQTTGSRATFFVSKSVTNAAEKLAQALKTKPLSELVGQIFAADVKVDDTTRLGATDRPIKTHSAYSFATQLCILDDKGEVERLVAAHDVGKIINPALCEGQLEGSLHMGLGYALTEELPCREGMPVSFKLRDIGVLRAQDMPEMEVLLLEVPAPEPPYGVKGVGEIGLVPTAAAVAGALLEFDGTPRFRLPMKESPAARAMSVGRLKGDRNEWQ